MKMIYEVINEEGEKKNGTKNNTPNSGFSHSYFVFPELLISDTIGLAALPIETSSHIKKRRVQEPVTPGKFLSLIHI